MVRKTRLHDILIAAIPFVVLAIIYLTVAHYRHAENANDKLMPYVHEMVHTIDRMALEKDEFTGKYTMWVDTLDSLKRFAIGLFSSAIVGLIVGMLLGLSEGFKKVMLPFLESVSNTPPISILPILLIIFGMDDFGKYMMIFIGTVFVILLDIYKNVDKMPYEQIVNAKTLGANFFQIAWYIILPQTMPRLLNAVRTSLGLVWVALITAEAIQSESGLGYRIFLVRRYMAMDVIIPYVIWITLLGFMMNVILDRAIKIFYPWYTAKN